MFWLELVGFDFAAGLNPQFANKYFKVDRWMLVWSLPWQKKSALRREQPFQRIIRARKSEEFGRKTNKNKRQKSVPLAFLTAHMFTVQWPVSRKSRNFSATTFPGSSPSRSLSLQGTGRRGPWERGWLFGWLKSLCTFNRDTFRALKLCSYFVFSFIWNILNEQVFAASGS